jgi:hypothetical protein
MSEAIDKQVLWGFLTELGWTRVAIDHSIDREYSENIVIWLRKHCKHPYEKYKETFIFENPGDATNFLLTWA